MKIIIRGIVGFIAIAIFALAARGLLIERPRTQKVQVMKTEPCPNGGVMYGKEYWPAGA